MIPECVLGVMIRSDHASSAFAENTQVATSVRTTRFRFDCFGEVRGGGATRLSGHVSSDEIHDQKRPVEGLVLADWWTSRLLAICVSLRPRRPGPVVFRIRDRSCNPLLYKGLC